MLETMWEIEKLHVLANPSIPSFYSLCKKSEHIFKELSSNVIYIEQ